MREIPRPHISVGDAISELMKLYRELEKQSGDNERPRCALRLGWMALESVRKLQDTPEVTS